MCAAQPTPTRQACWAPSAELPSLPSDLTGQAHVAAAVASLLYFDSIYCPTLATVPEIRRELQTSIPSPEQFSRLARDPRVARYAARKHDHGLTIDESVVVDMTAYIRMRAEFEKEYAPLWKEGVVVPISFCGTVQSLDSMHPAEAHSVQGWATMFVNDIVPHLSAVIAEKAAYADYNEWMADVARINSTLPVTAAYVREAFVQAGALKLLSSARAIDRAIFGRIVLLFDIFCRRILSGPLPVVTASNGYLHLQELMAAEVFAWRGMQPVPAVTQESIANKIAAHCIAELPVPFPRSAESILHVRQALRTELDAFRSVVSDAAEDIVLSETDGAAALHRQFAARISRPLRDLRRRLQSPNRELLRNLVSSQSIIAAVAVSLMAAMSTGINDISATVIGIATPTLTAAIKTLLDRRHDVQTSGLAFLIKLSAGE